MEQLTTEQRQEDEQRRLREHFSQQEPKPKRTVTVEIFGPEDKPREGEWVFAVRDDGYTRLAQFVDGQWRRLSDISDPVFWYYPIKLPVEIPKPWRKCEKGSMPWDEGRDYEMVQVLLRDGTKPQTYPSDRLNHEDCIAWAPIEALDTSWLTEYLKQEGNTTTTDA
jgi:hypothetical protein